MKMKSIVAVAALAVALTGTAASAQTPGAAQTTPEQKPEQKMSTSSNMSSNAFVQKAAVGGMAEVELGKLAAERASSAEVNQFAQRMVTDHSKANDELKALAQSKNMTLPSALDNKHKGTVDKLAKLNGAAFDRAYMDEMRSDHRKDVSDFRQQAKSGSDPDVKAFAAKALPTLEEHMQMAEKTHAAVGTAGRKDDGKSAPTGTTGAQPGDRGATGSPTGTSTGQGGNTAPTPGLPGSPGSPGSGSDPRNQPGSVPGTGIQR